MSICQFFSLERVFLVYSWNLEHFHFEILAQKSFVCVI